LKFLTDTEYAWAVRLKGNEMQIITVVRDKEFYKKCVRNNAHNSGARFVVYDNTKENIGIPTRYNDFLNKYDYADDDWLIFCHEDWETLEDLAPKVQELDKNRIYGVLGTVSNMSNRTKYYTGRTHVSNKDGSCDGQIGTLVPTGTEVDTFDCCALFIHSSLIKKYNIRFDENLNWHHYVEELNIRLREKFNIPSCIIKIESKHWSYGCPLPNAEFERAFNYVRDKFSDSKNVYSNTTVDECVGRYKGKLRRVYEKCLTGRRIFLLGLPVVNQKIDCYATKTYLLDIIPLYRRWRNELKVYLVIIPFLHAKWGSYQTVVKLLGIPVLKLKNRM